MGLLDIFRRKKSFKKVPLDELKREQIRLKQEERKLVAKVDEIENQKKEVFLSGKGEASETKRRILARNFKAADSKLQHLERNLQIISRQIRIINGFVAIKEDQQILKSMGLSKLIDKLDMAELQRYVEEASTEGEFMLEKFSQILVQLEDQEAAMGSFAEEKDIEEIMDVWRECEKIEDEEAAYESGLKKISEKKTKAAEEEFSA